MSSVTKDFCVWRAGFGEKIPEQSHVAQHCFYLSRARWSGSTFYNNPLRHGPRGFLSRGSLTGSRSGMTYAFPFTWDATISRSRKNALGSTHVERKILALSSQPDNHLRFLVFDQRSAGRQNRRERRKKREILIAALGAACGRMVRARCHPPWLVSDQSAFTCGCLPDLFSDLRTQHVIFQSIRRGSRSSKVKAHWFHVRETWRLRAQFFGHADFGSAFISRSIGGPGDHRTITKNSNGPNCRRAQWNVLLRVIFVPPGLTIDANLGGCLFFVPASDPRGCGRCSDNLAHSRYTGGTPGFGAFSIRTTLPPVTCTRNTARFDLLKNGFSSIRWIVMFAFRRN